MALFHQQPRTVICCKHCDETFRLYGDNLRARLFRGEVVEFVEGERQTDQSGAFMQGIRHAQEMLWELEGEIQARAPAQCGGEAAEELFAGPCVITTLARDNHVRAGMAAELQVAVCFSFFAFRHSDLYLLPGGAFLLV